MFMFFSFFSNRSGLMLGLIFSLLICHSSFI